MKKLISAMVIMGMSAYVLVKENAYWKYREKLSSGDTYYYLKNSEADKPFLALENAALVSVYNECTKMAVTSVL